MTTEQEIGALKAEVRNIKENMVEARDDRKAMLADITEIKQTLAEAKGYWKMLVMISGFAGAVGSFVTWLLSWVPMLPRQ